MLKLTPWIFGRQLRLIWSTPCRWLPEAPRIECHKRSYCRAAALEILIGPRRKARRFVLYVEHVK